MELRWMQPAGSAPVDWWRVYRNGNLAIEGLSPEPEAGVYSVALAPWPTGALYTMTAVNAGGESLHSNGVFLPELPETPMLLMAVAALALRARLRQVKKLALARTLA